MMRKDEPERLIYLERLDHPSTTTLRSGERFVLTHQANIHRTSDYLIETGDRRFMSHDTQAGERLASWMKTISYLHPPTFHKFRGEFVLMELTKHDAAKFKIFFC